MTDSYITEEGAKAQPPSLDGAVLENYIERITYGSRDSVEVYGNEEQRRALFEDFGKYLGEVKNPERTATNSFFKKAGEDSRYAPLDEVLNTVRPVLHKYGLTITQVPSTSAGQVSIRTIIFHKCGGSVGFPPLDFPVAGSKSQDVFSASTYARRCALTTILGIYGEEDDDGNAASGRTGTPAAKQGRKQISKDIVEKQNIVVALANELKGEYKIDRDKVVSTVEKACGNPNPNAVTDMVALDKAFTALSELRDKANKKKG